MYEELIEPLRMCFRHNSYLDFSEEARKHVVAEFGIDCERKMHELYNDFYAVNEQEEFSLEEFDKMKIQAEKNFLEKYPDTCTDVLNMLVNDYFFNNVMH